MLVKVLYDHEFDSPFLMTYVGGSLFTILLPLEWMRKKEGQLDGLIRNEYQLENDTNSTSTASADDMMLPPSSPATHSSYQQGATTLAEPKWLPPSPLYIQKPWTTQDHMIASAKLAPLWFLANYSYYASLQYISITSSTILASTASLFTFGFAYLLKEESFHWWKLTGILLGMAGAIWTAKHDAATAGDVYLGDDDGVWTRKDILGDLLGLLSAAGWGGYVVSIRVLCPKDESLMSMPLFLGFLGLWIFVALLPFVLLQLLVDTPVGLSAAVVGALVIKGLIDNVLSDYLWARSVILTSATVANVGMGLVVPMAFFCDVVIGEPDVFNPSSVFGALFVLVGFILVNLAQKDEITKNPTPSLQSQNGHASFV